MAVGLAAAATAAILANLGLVVQKMALDRRSSGVSVIRTFFTPRWLAGFAMVQLAWVSQLIALRTAPLYVVQPIIASGLLVLAAAARLRLKEQVAGREWASIIAIATGAATLSIFAFSGDNEAAFKASTGTNVALIAASTAIALAIAAATRFAGRRRAAGLAMSAGLLYALTVILSKPIAAMLEGSAAGALGEILGHYEIYAVAILSVTALLINQHALAAGRAITVVPIVVVVMALVPVVAGFVLFGESLPSGISGPAIVVSIFACVAGAGSLASVPAVARLVGDDDGTGSESEIV